MRINAHPPVVIKHETTLNTLLFSPVPLSTASYIIAHKVTAAYDKKITIDTADKEFSAITLNVHPKIMPLQKYAEEDSVILKKSHSGILIIQSIKKSYRHISDKALKISVPLKGDTGIIIQLFGVHIKLPSIKAAENTRITANANIN